MIEVTTDLGIHWLLTFLVHSTLFVAAAWVVCRVLRDRHVAVQNAAWKVALGGALLTATFQVAGAWQSPLGAMDLSGEPEPVALAPVELASPPVDDVHSIVVYGNGATIIARRSHALSNSAPLEAAAALAPTSPELALPTGWKRALLALWGLGVLVLVGRMALGLRRLRARLASRREVIEDPALETFLTLCSRAGIKRKLRLTVSEELDTPVAIWTREVCLPRRALEELRRGELEGVLAHELAHLVRRDPQWNAFAALVESVFFFQPLFRIARRNMEASAEMLADDWARALLGDGRPLAEALATVAAWIARPVPAGLCPAVGPRRPLLRRVERLLDRTRAPERGGLGRHLSMAAAAVAAVALLAPGFVMAAGPEESEVVESESADHNSFEFAFGPQDEECSEGDVLMAPVPPIPPIPPITIDLDGETWAIDEHFGEDLAAAIEAQIGAELGEELRGELEGEERRIRRRVHKHERARERARERRDRERARRAERRHERHGRQGAHSEAQQEWAEDYARRMEAYARRMEAQARQMERQIQRELPDGVRIDRRGLEQMQRELEEQARELEAQSRQLEREVRRQVERQLRDVRENHDRERARAHEMRERERARAHEARERARERAREADEARGARDDDWI